jgi:DNA-binding beta-propeller fold protein YncE
LSEDSLTGLWPLRDGQTLVGTGTTTLHFLPADLSGPSRQMTVCNEPIMGVTPFGVRDRAYAVCGESTLVEIDSKLEIVVRSAAVTPADSRNEPACRTGAVATSPSGSVVYVLCRDSGMLLYIDRHTLTAFDSVDVSAGGHDMVLVPGGRRAVVTRPDAHELVVVDLREREVVSRVHLEAPWSAAVGTDGRHSYVTTRAIQGPGRLLRIKLESATVVGNTQAVSGSLGIALWPSNASPRMRWN